MFNNEIAVINGRDSRDFGVYLIDGNIFDAPQREVEYVTIPGRSGSLTIDKGRWENIDITYTFAAYDNAIVRLNGWKNYLQANAGYQRIENSLESGLYRQGVLKNIASPKMSMQGGGGYIEVTFSCMPQKWYVDDTVEQIILSHNKQISNPTNFDAKPLLLVTASQVGEAVAFQNYIYDKAAGTSTFVNSGGVQVNTLDPIWIDCESGNAYDNGINYNSYIAVINDFPVILGQSKIVQNSGLSSNKSSDTESYTVIKFDSATSGISVIMYPRWWTL